MLDHLTRDARHAREEMGASLADAEKQVEAVWLHLLNIDEEVRPLPAVWLRPCPGSHVIRQCISAWVRELDP